MPRKEAIFKGAGRLGGRASGTLTIGYPTVYANVKTYPMTQKEPKSRLLVRVHKEDGRKLKELVYCEGEDPYKLDEDGTPLYRGIEKDEIAHGYEIAKGMVRILSEKALEKIDEAIERLEGYRFVRFIPKQPIPGNYIERVYHLEPADEFNKKQYTLLMESLKMAERYILAKVIIRTEHPCVILPNEENEKLLAMYLTHFSPRVADSRKIEGIRHPRVDREEIELGAKLIATLEKIPKYQGKYAGIKNVREELLKQLIEDELEGKFVLPPEPVIEAVTKEKLMQALMEAESELARVGESK